MLVNALMSKIYNIKITDVEVGFDDSCAIDVDYMDLVGIREFQQIDIYNVNNGERFTTYAIKAPSKSKKVSISGVTKKVAVGDCVIIVAYCMGDYDQLLGHEPKSLSFE